MPQNPTSLPFLVSYADTLSSAKSRPLIQTALTAIASLQEIDCVCIDNITLPDDIAEAGARLGAYTTADLVWFHFSKHSLMTQKVFEKAVRGLFAHSWEARYGCFFCRRNTDIFTLLHGIDCSFHESLILVSISEGAQGIEPWRKNHTLPCVFPHRHPSLNAFRVVTLGFPLSFNIGISLRLQLNFSSRPFSCISDLPSIIISPSVIVHEQS